MARTASREPDPPDPPDPPDLPARRADAQRNRAAIVAAAADVFLRDGADASLEQIARRAGVGSATLHRHFHGRADLLEAVFADAVSELCVEADDLGRTADPRDGLRRWLTSMARHCARSNALAAMIQVRPGEPDPQHRSYERLARAGQPLRDAAVGAGVLAPEVTIQELLRLVNGIALASNDHPDVVDRLVGLAWDGVGPR